MHKNELRYLIGTSLQAMNLVEPFRAVYACIAKSYLWNFREPHLKAAWVRRSLVTTDFKPFCSDIDMTVLIDDRVLPELFLSRQIQRWHPVKDVQFVSMRFLPHWIKTGGFRNRQNSNWKQIYGFRVDLTSPAPGSRQEIAFELGYEIHLLYRQLLQELQIYQAGLGQYSHQAITKLLTEVERLRLYWQTQDANWIHRPRGEIAAPTRIKEYFNVFEEFCKEIIAGLARPLNEYSWQHLISHEDELGFALHLAIDQQQVFILKNPEDIALALRQKPEHFVTTAAFVQLIKGIGVQEQTLLNQLAAEGSNYYRSFNGQRVAHDLIGAMLLEPDNLEQLYFCFMNISRFHESITGRPTSDWEQIESSWNGTGKLPYSQAELPEVVVRYLDLVADII